MHSAQGATFCDYVIHANVDYMIHAKVT